MAEFTFTVSVDVDEPDGYDDLDFNAQLDLDDAMRQALLDALNAADPEEIDVQGDSLPIYWTVNG